ncbi:MAG: hypothetical protein JRE92_09590 [Deltaproteobacteria bacterium]|nr:hypothetical protein [Deltaproteobacteria bacterium]
MRNCTEDEGGPLGVGLQEQASNRLKLLWPKVMVVSVEEKAWQKTVSGEDQGDERKRTIDEVSKNLGWRQNWSASRSSG